MWQSGIPLSIPRFYTITKQSLLNQVYSMVWLFLFYIWENVVFSIMKFPYTYLFFLLALLIFYCVVYWLSECAMKIIKEDKIYYTKCLYGRKLFLSLNSNSSFFQLPTCLVSIISVNISFLWSHSGIINEQVSFHI